MRLTIAVPGAAECNVDRPLDRESGANPQAVEMSEPHAGQMTVRESVEGEDEVDLLTPLNSASSVMHKRVQEVMRQVGGALNITPSPLINLALRKDTRPMTLFTHYLLFIRNNQQIDNSPTY
jgi:hypothetical protein